MPAFLLEIGLEEIPAGMVAAAQAELAKRFRELVTRERFAGDDFGVTGFSTPRRLAIVANGLLAKQADMEELVVGPSVAVAYKNGAATPAAVAFAKKSAVEVGELKTIQNAKGEYVTATVRRVGRSAAEVLTSLLPVEIAGITWPKNMYWRAGKPERFVRPVRWMVALLDEEIVPVVFAGITADAVSYGHRVLHGSESVVIGKPQEYAEKLRAAYVEVDPEARRHKIRKALDAATRQIPGAHWREDETLVDTLTHLTEWPSVILGGFEASYLDLPSEVLVTVMRDHQKYFALEDENSKLLANFLAVLNLEVDAAGAAIIRHGNERVLRARFNDARFFWDVDQKIPLIERVEKLKNVTFQKDIGSYWDKTQRIKGIAERLQARIGITEGIAIEDFYGPVWRASELSKADLTTEMVKEFTELQGQVGGLYAARQGESQEVADAVYDHYKPTSASDSIPRSRIGCVLSLADKLDTIVEMFRIDKQPTGSKDPFALRRAGNGIIRILLENEEIGAKLHLIRLVFATSGQIIDGTALETYDFFLDRFEYYLQDSLRLRLQVARAIRKSGIASMDIALDPSRGRLGERTESDYGFGKVAAFAKVLNEQVRSSDVLAVAELLKRTSNILRQAREKGIVYPGSPTAEMLGESPDLLKEVAEIELSRKVTEADALIQRNYREGKYDAVIASIAALQLPLNAFFESVMVMVEDSQLRDNRLALLSRTESTVRWAADFSELASL
jgi:glycyl-tRNA synthetase beta chain